MFASDLVLTNYVLINEFLVEAGKIQICIQNKSAFHFMKVWDCEIDYLV